MDLRSVLLTGSTASIAYLMRWGWTKILRWWHALIVYVSPAFGKISQTSLTTEHRCSCEMVVYVLERAVLSDVKCILPSFKCSYWNSKIKRSIFARPVYIIELINFKCWNSKSWPPKSCGYWFGEGKEHGWFEFNTKSCSVTIILGMCLWIEWSSSKGPLMFVIKVSDIFIYSDLLSKSRQSSRRMLHKTSVPNDLGYSCEDDMLLGPLILEVLWNISPKFQLVHQP